MRKQEQQTIDLTMDKKSGLTLSNYSQKRANASLSEIILLSMERISFGLKFLGTKVSSLLNFISNR